MTIVGVVQPRENASAAMLSSGIAYPASLTRHVLDTAAQSRLVPVSYTHRHLADKVLGAVDAHIVIDKLLALQLGAVACQNFRCV